MDSFAKYGRSSNLQLSRLSAMEGTMQNKRKQNSCLTVLLTVEVPNLNWFVCLPSKVDVKFQILK